MPVGGSNRYPSLETVATLFRASINDTFSGEGGAQGLIMPDTNPDLLTFMNSAIKETYSDLRNVGDPELILDNDILLGLPVVNSALGAGVPNPMAQVSLSYTGFFDGLMNWPDFTLPITAQRIERLWERLSGTNDNFSPMHPAPFGLPGTSQVQRMGMWEMRQGAVWMPGCLVPIDLRLRCRIDFPPYLDADTLDFETTYIPILGCVNSIVAKMLILYARRFAPDMYQMAIAEEDRYMKKLKLEVVLQMQNTEYQRDPFGEEAVTEFSSMWISL